MEEKSGLYSKQYLKRKNNDTAWWSYCRRNFLRREVSTGAIDDLHRVMDIAKRMVTELMEGRKFNFFFHMKNKNMIDEQIIEIIDEAYQEVYEKVERNKNIFIFSKRIIIS